MAAPQDDPDARLRSVVANMSHDLRAVRRRALNALSSKLEYGLVEIADLPAHDVVARGLELAEREASEPTAAHLTQATDLLRAVVETHPAGGAALVARAPERVHTWRRVAAPPRRAARIVPRRVVAPEFGPEATRG